MFADLPIYGEEIISVDNKGRIILPRMTNAETNELLMLLKKSKYYEIMSKEDFDSIVLEIENKIKYCLIESEKEFFEEELTKILFQAKREIKVSSNGRVTLGSDFSKMDKIKIIGSRKSIRLYQVEKTL